MSELRSLLILIELILLIWPVCYLYKKNKGNIDCFQPIIVFISAFSLFYLFPHLYYYLLQDLFLFTELPLLAIVNLCWLIVALLSFYCGYYLYKKYKPTLNISFRNHLDTHKVTYIVIIFITISIASFLYFMHSVGGFKYYITHLNKTIPLTKGKMYLIWGMLLLRSSFLIHLLHFIQRYKSINRTRKSIILLLVHFLSAAVLITTIGARLIALSFCIELIVFFHYATKRISLFKVSAIAALSFCLFVIVMGAWRNYGWKGERNRKPFFKYLCDDIQTNLGNRLFNNYFDSVRNFSFVLKYTGNGIPIQNGRTYLALFVQPIPRTYRPKIELPLEPKMKYIRTTGGGPYGGIDPLIGELYQNFPLIGIPLGLLLLGFLSRWVYQELVISKGASHFSFLLYGIWVYSIFFWLRGAFVGHTSL
ncbi:MAG: oligosaccharide repeat unit polymerase, partial [Candidatus Ranarchaeia archaeon]